jgi:dTDP-4-dehydrorhamnose 3,5-epimerase
MKIEPLEIPDVKLVTQPSFPDERGRFINVWGGQAAETLGFKGGFVQWSMSESKRGVLRGLHFQNPNAQDKLITVLNGSIFDVAVDMRRNSPSFGKWVARTLQAEDMQQIFIPAGFAHGFQALMDGTRILYGLSGSYSPGCEGGILWSDGNLGIPWPISEPVLSEKDAKYPLFSQVKHFL